MINYVYRLFLRRDCEEGGEGGESPPPLLLPQPHPQRHGERGYGERDEQHGEKEQQQQPETELKTAILKYATTTAWGDPSIKLSVDRQVYETRALREIPWRAWRGVEDPPNPNGEREGVLCSRVMLPEVYFEDLGNHVFVMQDVGDCQAEAEGGGNSFQGFCEKVWEDSERKVRMARAIGSMLGAFFAQLHEWGRGSESHARVEEMFGGNDEVTKLIIELHMRNVLENIEKVGGCELSQEREKVLVTIMEELERSVYQQRETVILHDIRLVILLSTGEPPGKASLTIQ